jgi:alcohol dehydrogenase class IV
MDALAHAIESFTNRSYQPISEALTVRAIELIGKYLVRAVKNGTDREARYGMLLGSTLAGIGMNPTRLGIVHALAMPLGSWDLKIPHGTGNSVLLPHVMEFNLISDLSAYARVALALGVDTAGLSDASAARKAVERVRTMSMQMGLPMGLGELGLTEGSIPRVCAEAMKSDNVKANPRPCTQADLETICRLAL